MKRTLVLASLLAFGLAAAAQNTSQAKTDSQAYQAATALSSNGPVSLDYKGMPLQSNDPVEVNIAKQVVISCSSCLITTTPHSTTSSTVCRAVP